MSRPLRIDLVVAQPVVLDLLRRTLVREGVEVASAATTWDEFARSWDFAAPAVLVDAHLDDHVPLPLKVRALHRAGAQVAVLGRQAEVRLALRARAEGAGIWLSPQAGAAEIAVDVVTWLTAGPAGPVRPGDPTSAHPALAHGASACPLTDRELQVLALYASRRGHTATEVAEVLGISTDTVRSHLRSGRARLTALGHDVGSRGRLQQVMVAEGYLEGLDHWHRLHRW